MAKLAHGPGLNLAYPLTTQVEVLADLVKCAGLTPIQSETLPEDLSFAPVEDDEHLVDLTREQCGGHGVERGDRRMVLQHVAEFGGIVLSQRLRQRQRHSGVAKDLGNLLLTDLLRSAAT